MTGTGWGIHLSFENKQWQLGVLPDQRHQPPSHPEQSDDEDQDEEDEQTDA